MITVRATALHRVLVVCLLAAALLATALLSTAHASAKRASVRSVERAVSSNVRHAMHTSRRADVVCQDNKGWFGCHWTIANGRNWTIGNALVRYRSRRSAKIKIHLFAVQCVGTGCKKKG